MPKSGAPGPVRSTSTVYVPADRRAVLREVTNRAVEAEAGVERVIYLEAGTAGRAGTVRRAHLSTVGTALCTCIHLVLLYSALHSLYYLLYAPLFADLDVTLPDILASLVSAPFQAPSREQFQDTMLFMRHFGLLRKVR
mmetsp:Transcript_23010/g.51600  ORF Transcript_23010/g.51600 Transcript_23010/m.51600 type:complete len:139 (-) Transcript_23010:185-601(-)